MLQRARTLWHRHHSGVYVCSATLSACLFSLKYIQHKESNPSVLFTKHRQAHTIKRKHTHIHVDVQVHVCKYTSWTFILSSFSDPPAVPRNLTCFQEGEFGIVYCTWKTGLETHIKTTSHLWSVIISFSQQDL